MTRRFLKPRILSFRASSLICRIHLIQYLVVLVVFKMMIFLRSWKSPRKKEKWVFPSRGLYHSGEHTFPYHVPQWPYHSSPYQLYHSGYMIPHHTICTTQHHMMYKSGEEGGGAQGNSRHFSQSGFFTAAAFFTLNQPLFRRVPTFNHSLTPPAPAFTIFPRCYQICPHKTQLCTGHWGVSRKHLKKKIAEPTTYLIQLAG